MLHEHRPDDVDDGEASSPNSGTARPAAATANREVGERTELA